MNASIHNVDKFRKWTQAKIWTIFLQGILSCFLNSFWFLWNIADNVRCKFYIFSLYSFGSYTSRVRYRGVTKNQFAVFFKCYQFQSQTYLGTWSIRYCFDLRGLFRLQSAKTLLILRPHRNNPNWITACVVIRLQARRKDNSYTKSICATGPSQAGYVDYLVKIQLARKAFSG